jgi:hypothetical protein
LYGVHTPIDAFDNILVDESEDREWRGHLTVREERIDADGRHSMSDDSRLGPQPPKESVTERSGSMPRPASDRETAVWISQAKAFVWKQKDWTAAVDQKSCVSHGQIKSVGGAR